MARHGAALFWRSRRNWAFPSRWLGSGGPPATWRRSTQGLLSRDSWGILRDGREPVRLLVVEDQPRMAALLGRGLEEEGYAVDVASDGEAAHWLAMENDYDVIVLDVMLPGMDGFSLCQYLRAAGRSAPVIMVTARDGVNDRVRGLDSGADDYLVKPFSFSELCARIRALIRRGHQDRSPALVVGEL